MGALLPVITVLTDAAGIAIGDAQELRIGLGLTATRVTGDGPDRIEIVVTTSSLLPFIPPVVQPAVLADAEGATRLVFAAVGAPSRVTRAAFFAKDNLAANDTNFVGVYLQEVDDAGAPVGSPIAGTLGTTKTSGSGGSGNWTAGALIFDFGIGIDLAAGHSIVAFWDSRTGTGHGTGVTMSGGEWRIT